MSNKPPRPKSTEEILREMEAMSEGVGSPSGEKHEGKGAFKSLMNFFIKIEPEDEATPAPPEFTKPPQQSPRAAWPQTPRPQQLVADLIPNEPAPKFKEPTTVKDDLAQREFEQIYQDAGLPKSPCPVDELTRLMENPAVANQPLSVK